jgi:activating signal cointegrator complex subunit 2
MKFADMPSNTSKILPAVATFPEAEWRARILPHEWAACLDAWIALVDAHLSLRLDDFSQISTKDESLAAFLTSYVRELAILSPDIPSFNEAEQSRKLRKDAFFLIGRLMDTEPPPKPLVESMFLADLCKAYGKKHCAKLITPLWVGPNPQFEYSIGSFKASLTPDLEAGIRGNPRSIESRLKRLNHLLHASPETASFFMSGSDFLDGLVSCYKLTDPPLRKAIIATTYLCLIGLTEGEKPSYSILIDQLYALKAAAEAHKAGPTNMNDSLVAEFVSVTPILSQVKDRIERHGTYSVRAKPIIASVETFRKPVSVRPKRLVKRKINKGKAPAKATSGDEYSHGTAGIHVHRMSLVSQVQDLFPDLGAGFIVQLLDEYADNVELIIQHLLEDSLPPHLSSLDRSQPLSATRQATEPHVPHLSPRPTPPLSPSIPTRRNIFDNDDFDQLAIDTSRLHFGRKDKEKTADDVLKDRSTAPSAAAIRAALAAFDSDDDERDDTYDAADVGGAVDVAGLDSTNPEEARDRDGRAGIEIDVQDEALFRAWKMDQGIFARDAATRRGKERQALRTETSMTDEAIEGWALMLSRDPRRLRRLESKFSSFTGQQAQIAPSHWRADSGMEGSDMDGGYRGRGAFRGMGRAGGGRGRGRGGSVAGPPGQDTERARDRKEQNKGRGANHNRRDQRARKVARAGFPG